MMRRRLDYVSACALKSVSTDYLERTKTPWRYSPRKSMDEPLTRLMQNAQRLDSFSTRNPAFCQLAGVETFSFISLVGNVIDRVQDAERRAHYASLRAKRALTASNVARG